MVRGVPLDRAGDFFLPLWTDFAAGPEAGILDWYTLLVAITALLTLTVHGALWLALKNRGALHARARVLASLVWWAVLASVIAITLVSFRVQPHLQQSFDARPWAYAFPLIALVGLFAMKIMNTAGRAMNAFLSSCVFILGMLTSVAAGLYPYVLPSSADPALSLTIHNTAARRRAAQIPQLRLDGLLIRREIIGQLDKLGADHERDPANDRKGKASRDQDCGQFR